LRNEESKNFALAGGGTGGHIFPALAIAAELKRIMPEIKITYLGKKSSLEEKLASRYGWDFSPIPARPLRRKLSPANLLIPFTVMRGSSMTRAILKRNGIGGLLGTGGYVSVPALRGARKAGAKIFLQEQNSYPGLATRLFARYADAVFLAYDNAKKYLSAQANITNIGNPLRPDFSMVSKQEGQKFFGLSRDKKTLLIFGGSQGALALNRKVKDNLDIFKRAGNIQLIWQVGEYKFEVYKQAFEDSGIDGVVLKFIDRMEMAYAAADLAFCRSGALSLAELAACGLPSILVPYPYAAEDHQYHNARVFEESGAAIVVRQSELEDFDLAGYVSGLCVDEEKLEEMSSAASAMADLKASEKIANKIIEVMRW
jgi:UDP-N-acetylglucosamine--N-acetylmuramyl-(pentapeptide) pyrophosphoryl-undecaprenol N-acetylglucosamine transferase